MNQRQAKRVLCGALVHWLSDGYPTDEMTDADAERIRLAAEELQMEMLRRYGAGWPPGDFVEIVKAVEVQP